MSTKDGDENDGTVDGRPKATVTRLPGTRLNVHDALAQVAKLIPEKAETLLATWYDKEGRVQYVAIGRNGELLWLAQTMATCLVLGISSDTGFDEED